MPIDRRRSMTARRARMPRLRTPTRSPIPITNRMKSATARVPTPREARISWTVVVSAPCRKTSRSICRATAPASAPGAVLARMVVPTGSVVKGAMAASEPARPQSARVLVAPATRNCTGPSGPVKMGVFRHGRPDFGVALEATFSTGELEGSGRQLVVVQRVQGYVLALLQNSITEFDIPTVVPGRHCDLPQDLRTDR